MQVGIFPAGRILDMSSFGAIGLQPGTVAKKNYTHGKTI
jgi:hypothetical protein